MRRTWFLLLFLFSAGLCQGQGKPPVGKTVNKDSNIVYVNSAFERRSPNERETWGGFLSSAIQTGGGALSFQALPYGLWQMIHEKGDTIDYAYGRGCRKTILRNVQLAGSITPDKKNNFQFDDAGYGASFTFLNNMKASQKLFDRYNRAKKSAGDIVRTDQEQRMLLDLINDPSLSSDERGRMVNDMRAYIDGRDTIQIMQDKYRNGRSFRDSLFRKLNIRYLGEAFLIQDSIYQNFIDKVARQVLLVNGCGVDYDFQKNFTHSISDSITFFKVICSDAKKNTLWSLQATGGYTWAVDSTRKGANFSRDYVRGSAGIDYQANKWFEVKLAFDLTHMISGQYKNEQTDNVYIGLTPRVTISKKLSFPVTVKFDLNSKKPQPFGFISVQYSLK